MLNSFSSIIELWPTADALATDLHEKPDRVRKWKQRNRIPSEYWIALVNAALARGFAEVTLGLLASLAASGGEGCEACANYLPPEEAALPGLSVGEMEEEFGGAATEAALEPRGSAPVFSED